jgi:Zn-dependent hydrolases, including glyoxylases
MAAEYEIFPLYLGEIVKHEKSSHTYMHHYGEKIRSVFYAFLLKGNRKNILVDTGPCDELWAEKYHIPIHVPKNVNILNVLETEHGLHAENIDYIINTHLHWDHCFNNNLFPGKKIYVQRKEYHYALDPLSIHGAVYESPQYGIIPNWMKVANQFEFIDGDIDIDDGISVLLLSGHSDGLQGVLVNTSEGKYLLASDCVNLYENWEGTDKLPYTLSAIHSDIKAYVGTMDRLKEMERQDHIIIIPGHDERIMNFRVFPEQK